MFHPLATIPLTGLLFVVMVVSRRAYLLGRCEKGKPLVRRGRKAKGCPSEVAGQPNRGV